MAPTPAVLDPNDRLPTLPGRGAGRRLTAVLATALLLAGGVLRADEPPQEPVSVPRFTHPGAGQVFYFVMTDRFANGSTANDTGGIKGGPDSSGFDPTRISHYHGGDLIGLTSKLDYIKQLGVTAIWITPPFKNKPMQEGTASYHGYWILDFTAIDPHLGSEADFREFVTQAHARGLRVYLDIVANHTADVIRFRDGTTTYIDMAAAPYRDSAGKPFDPHLVAFNGLGSGSDFPSLSAERSFAHIPVVAPGEDHSKGPDWLNDLTLYHNRGNSRFVGESSMHGDFGGLDDLFTESPTVVRGFIDIYGRWIERFGIDGFRIDTVKHVNLEFWEAFAPAIRARARELGRPDFFQFGEVADHTGDAALMSEFSTTGNLDAVLDFGFYDGARDFVSRGHDASGLARIFEKDAWYTGPASNAQGSTTFISNHDDGRFGYFLKVDNPGAGTDRMCDLFLLGQELLLTVRGQPVIYYGDEQGMVGTGNDMGAREDMFPSRSPVFRDLALLGTTRRGGDDKFDVEHPFYRTIRRLAALRTGSPALSRGAMLVRASSQPHVFAFSRIERAERVEFLVALNNSRTEAATAELATCQPEGAGFSAVFDSRNPDPAGGPTLAAAAGGKVTVMLAPLQCVIWRALAPLPPPGTPPTIRFARPASGSTLVFAERSVVGQTITERQEIGAEVSGGDGFAEVTFVLARASRPGPVRAPGHRGLAALSHSLEAAGRPRPRRGAHVPCKRGRPARPPGVGGDRPRAGSPRLPCVRNPRGQGARVHPGARVLGEGRAGRRPRAHGLGIRHRPDGIPVAPRRPYVAGATLPVLTVEDVAEDAAGHYVALVHNREGTAVSRDAVVRVGP